MIADIDATKVKPGTMTSSPGPMPSADSRIQIALVPELTATAWLTPTSSATLFSSVSTSAPNAGSSSGPYRPRYPLRSTRALLLLRVRRSDHFLGLAWFLLVRIDTLAQTFA